MVLFLDRLCLSVSCVMGEMDVYAAKWIKFVRLDYVDLIGVVRIWDVV